MNVKGWRRSCRTELLARRESVPKSQRSEWNSAITALLVEYFPVLRSLSVGFYWPFKGEFDPRYLMRELRERGATTALPVVVEKSAPLQFRRWWPGVPMTKGLFDLPIPLHTNSVVPEALLIPPVGFDAHGYRLGYGGGYFDRTLAAMGTTPLKIGVGFELSRIATIRPQPHDVAMDFVVTEAGIERVVAGVLVPWTTVVTTLPRSTR
jgi:5-formyltetrahydrofolate cyclo-ligase